MTRLQTLPGTRRIGRGKGGTIMEISIFGKQSCSKCRTTKNKLNHLVQKWGVADTVPLRYYDLQSVDGMTEGAFRDVMGIPTVIVDQGAREVGRWTALVPKGDEIKKMVTEEKAEG
jgi:hypothetical protein